jgi:FHS family L-fucose permease-like MFS transporter
MHFQAKNSHHVLGCRLPIIGKKSMFVDQVEQPGVAAAPADASAGRSAAFAAVTTLFFAWGFVTSMLDPLVAAVRTLFHLNYTEALLTQFAFFMAYGIVSLPAAALAARIRNGSAILLSLAAMLAGVLLMLLAVRLDTYALMLAALFVLASGITLLQVVANPLAASLGSPERSHFRLAFAQSFNSLGTVLGPALAARLLLREGVFGVAAGTESARRTVSLGHLGFAYELVAVATLALMAFILSQRRRIEAAAAPPAQGNLRAALASRWALLGALGIFLYVGAEVSVGGIMINFLHQPRVLGLELARAGQLVSYYWLGALAGRFIGTLLLRGRIRATDLLAGVAAGAAALCLCAALFDGWPAAMAAIAIGLMNAIMFPTIFTLTMERSSAGQAATSGLLCCAIVGGAILPVIAGQIADLASLNVAFCVPLCAYLGIVGFALAARAHAPFRLV